MFLEVSQMYLSRATARLAPAGKGAALITCKELALAKCLTLDNGTQQVWTMFGARVNTFNHLASSLWPCTWVLCPMEKLATM